MTVEFPARIATSLALSACKKVIKRVSPFSLLEKKPHLKEICGRIFKAFDQLVNIKKRTLENLIEAAAGEHYEQKTMYPEFAATAREEGFDEIAKIFEAIAVAEKQHEKRYNDLAANIKSGSVFKKKDVVTWRCRNCGYLHEGTEAPKICPACAHPQAHFEVLYENW